MSDSEDADRYRTRTPYRASCPNPECDGEMPYHALSVTCRKCGREFKP